MAPAIAAPSGILIVTSPIVSPFLIAIGVPGRAGRLAPATLPRNGALLAPTMYRSAGRLANANRPRSSDEVMRSTPVSAPMSTTYASRTGFETPVAVMTEPLIDAVPDGACTSWRTSRAGVCPRAIRQIRRIALIV